jgi:hypothetical protein
VYHQTSDTPFRASLPLLGEAFSVRFDGWLPFETFRRGGFGRVLRGREPVLPIERGVSLVWFAADGSARMVYAAGLYAPKGRVRIPAAAAHQLAQAR